MSEESEIMQSLKEMRASLKVLASEKRNQLLDELKTKSPKRKEMWGLFNGRRTLSEIAKLVKTSLQAVQQFADECHRDGLIDYLKPAQGKGLCPRRIE